MAAVDRENVERLMEWLAEGSEVRSAHASAESLVDKLASMVFSGEREWPGRADQADAYAQSLDDWLADDSGSERRFVELTGPGAEPGMFLDWFLPVVLEREGRAARGAAGQPEEDAPETGWSNPGFDGTNAGTTGGAMFDSSKDQGLKKLG
ncbi:hypothetical protein [Streptacidiphilus anmyonensis]|uniref:hypothetical protein n=1 Tax=Streptacidiphilus anmyonensis TaxID=405782 RepID=UPI0005AB0D1F|nr:hypothetical protein [Streptacidiphilus anmyonensis]